MGSVSYRKVGSRWHIRFREQGRETVKTYDGSLPEYAIERKSRWYRDEWERGYFNPFDEQKEDLQLKTALQRYCSRKRRRGDWNEHTAKISEERLRQAADFAGPQLKLSELRSHDFQRWLDSLSGSPYTRRSYQSTLNTFLKWCYQHNLTTQRLKVRLPDPDRRQIQTIRPGDFLIKKDMEKICNHLCALPPTNVSTPRFHDRSASRLMADLCHLMFWQLLTPNNLFALTCGDIDIRQNAILVETEENRKSRLPIVPPVRSIISTLHPDQRDSLTPLIAPEIQQSLKDRYQEAVQEEIAGKKPDLRQLRRGGIIHYLKLEKPISYISRLARHPNIETTLRRYKPYLPEMHHEAFEDIGE